MRESQNQLLDRLFSQYPALAPQRMPLLDAYSILLNCFQLGKKVLTCGNGGSAADSEHIVGELMKGFLLKRPLTEKQRASIEKTGLCPNAAAFAAGLQQGLPAISLVSQTALMTAFLNDVGPAMVFAQQVFTYGREGDVLIALSTSGGSANVVNAAVAAKAQGMKVVTFTGRRESALSAASDAAFRAPSEITFEVQEYHLPLYHTLCGLVELALFDE